MPTRTSRCPEHLVEANDSPEADATSKGVAKGLAALGGSLSTVTVTPIVAGVHRAGSQVKAGAVAVKAIARPLSTATIATYEITAANPSDTDTDPTSNTITVTNHNLQTGDVIEYQSGVGNDEIGGLTQTYTRPVDPRRRRVPVVNVHGSTA